MTREAGQNVTGAIPPRARDRALRTRDQGPGTRERTGCNSPSTPTTSTSTRANRTVDGSNIDIEAIARRHYAIDWQRCGDDGTPDLDQPLPPFCAACSDPDYVAAIEYGDTIDEAAGVVSWPCEVVELINEIGRHREHDQDVRPVVRSGASSGLSLPTEGATRE